MNKELLSMVISEPSESEIRQLCRAKKDELGFDIEKALFPVNPLLIDASISIDDALVLLKEWALVRDSAWDSVRDSVGDSVGAYISSIFYGVEKWRYVEHKPGVNPFQSCIDLWESGYIASYDGKKWRLHTGKNAKIVWEGGLT